MEWRFRLAKCLLFKPCLYRFKKSMLLASCFLPFLLRSPVLVVALTSWDRELCLVKVFAFFLDADLKLGKLIREKWK